MIEHRPFSSLGRFENDWLNANYHFSFSRYVDRNRMGLGALRVWNDDTIQPDTGFPPHGHESMEIITYVRTGAITHTDSMGNKGRTEAGDVQVMSAGSGVQHSEWNAEDVETTLFQIWIVPRVQGGPPAYGALEFPKEDRAGHWTVFASGDGVDDSLTINQDARVMGATVNEGEAITVEIPAGRFGYLVLARGAGEFGELELGPRDGVAIAGPETLTFIAKDTAELVLVDTV